MTCRYLLPTHFAWSYHIYFHQIILYINTCSQQIQKAKEDALKPPEPEEKPSSESVDPSEGQSSLPTEGLESVATQVGDPQGVSFIMEI